MSNKISIVHAVSVPWEVFRLLCTQTQRTQHSAFLVLGKHTGREQRAFAGQSFICLEKHFCFSFKMQWMKHTTWSRFPSEGTGVYYFAYQVVHCSLLVKREECLCGELSESLFQNWKHHCEFSGDLTESSWCGIHILFWTQQSGFQPLVSRIRSHPWKHSRSTI